MANVTREQAKRMVDDYCAGRRAGRADAPAPDGASADFLRGFEDVRHERRVAAAGFAYKQGRVGIEALAAAVKS